jgi:hypothetical protein
VRLLAIYIIPRLSYFEGGHMMYTRPSAHKVLKNDVAKFIADTSGPKSKVGTQ